MLAVAAGACRPKARAMDENLPLYQWVDTETAIRDLRAGRRR